MRFFPCSPVCTVASAFLAFGPLCAQDVEPPIIPSEVVELGGRQLEYFTFGSSGLPVVWIQDHHDYFRASTAGREESEDYVGFLRTFADSFRVIAPVRRGWGASEHGGYGFDVASQAEDVLGLLDALGIERAVFVGRTLATQDIIWIAEHHPERAIGLVLLGTPFTGEPLDRSVEEERWAAMYNRLACDIGVGEEVDVRLQPRASYRAHFMEEQEVSIDIPALLSLHPVVDGVGFDLRRLDRLEAGELLGNEPCDAEAATYFEDLAVDPGRIAELRRAFQAQPAALERVREAMQDAFGERLRTVWEEGGYGYEPWYPLIRTFLEDLASG